MDNADTVIAQLQDEVQRLRERNTQLEGSVAAQQRGADALQRSEARFRLLIEQCPLSTQIFAPDGRTLQVNRAWEQLWGVTLAEMGDYNILQDPQLVAKGIMPAIQRGFAGEAVAIPPIRYDPDATIPDRSHNVDPVRWVRAVIFPVTDDRGHVGEVVLIHEDITEQKRMEAALRQSESEYRAMFDLAGAGTVEVDVHTARFRRVNRRFCAFTGYTAEELLTMTFLDITYPEEQLRDQGVVQEMARGERAEYTWEKRYVRKDGGIVWGDVTATVLHDAAGQPRHTIAVVHDITRRKQLEAEAAELLLREQAARAEAQEAVRVRDAFLALAAHELKTPLTTVLGNAELLQRHTTRAGGLAKRDQDGLTTIIRQAKRLNQLISDLLDLARLDTGQLTIESALLDARVLVERVVSQAEPSAEQHMLRLCLPDAPLLVEGDELRLEQALENLLGNAIKYSPAGGVITVRAERREAEIWISVTDQGLGIAAESLPQLFGRFYRAANAQALSGNGIGLYVVNEIVRLHGGHVAVASREGQGSTFTICLPAGSLATAGSVLPDLKGALSSNTRNRA